MGCWNETCGLTNLPIRSGEPVAAIALQLSKKAVSNTYRESAWIYPDDHYTPVGFPVFGEYDDYGNVQNVRTHPWNQELLQIAGTPEQGSHNLQNTDFQQPVMFMHKEIYQKVIDHLGSRLVNGKPYRECIRDDIVDQLNRDRSTILSWESPMRCSEHANPHIAKFLLDKYDHSADGAEKQAAIDAVVDSRLLYHALLLLRKGYLTVSGTGNQCEETALHVLVARFIIEHAQTANMDYDPPEFLKDGYEEPIYFF